VHAHTFEKMTYSALRDKLEGGELFQSGISVKEGGFAFVFGFHHTFESCQMADGGLTV
jgi:hypothetical protein